MNASQAKLISMSFADKDIVMQSAFDKIELEANKGRSAIAIPHSELDQHNASKLINLGYKVEASALSGHWIIAWG
jgi:hypothetical protein